MAMSDTRILEARAAGNIIIDPFRPDFLNTSSYDVCLGEWFYRERKSTYTNEVFNIYDPSHVDRIWGRTAAGSYSLYRVRS